MSKETKMMRKKVLLFPILLLLTLSLFSTLNVNITSVSAGEYPAIYVDPPSVTDVTPDENFTVSICTDYAGDDVWGWQFTLYYNPYVLHGVEVTNGDLIEDPTMFIPGEFDNEAGALSLTGNFFFFITEPAPTTSGPGTLANVTFTVVGTGESSITIGDETQLKGYTEGGYGDPYNIIDAITMPDHIQHGYFCNIAPTPDVAVTDIRASSYEVNVTDPAQLIVTISVDVANEGDFPETFNVTIRYDTTDIDTKTVDNLAAGDSTTIDFEWDVTGMPLRTYTIEAEAILTGDVDSADNKMTSHWTIDIVPEFPTPMPLLLALAILAVSMMVLKRRHL